VPERWQRVRTVNTTFRSGETDDHTVITLETSAIALPNAWVNFLKQRLHVLHLDCKYIGAGQIVVTSTPPAAESVARLVYSAMECANDYFKAVLRSM
jgi:hypothetical protein